MEENIQKQSLSESDQTDGHPPEAEIETLKEKYFTFRLDGQMYAIPVSNIVGIGPLAPFRNIPGMPYFMKGITVLRGDVVPIIDLRAKLMLSPQEPDGQTSIIYIQKNAQQLGFIVDSVDEVTTIHNQEFTDSGHLTDAPELDYITGVSRHNENTVLHIDLLKLIDNDDLKVDWY